MRYAAALLIMSGCASSVPSGPDLAIGDLTVATSVVSGKPVVVQLKIVLRQLDGRDVRLQIGVSDAAGTVVARDEQDARLPGPGMHALEFTLKAPPVGEYRLAVRLPVQPGEIDADNNTASAPFTVRPPRPRVLYVEHPPRYEYRFLKNALIRDASLFIHCWLQSADDDYPQEHTRDTTDPRFGESLASMPKNIGELLEYDVVIIGDVDPSKLPVDALRSFVEDHGRGIIFIAGSVNAIRHWQGSPLSKLLPVDLAAPAAEVEVAEKTCAYRLTPEGRINPLVRFPAFKDDARNAEHWEDGDRKQDGLPGVRWFARATSKEGSRALVEVGLVDAWWPLFVTSPAGRGRVFFSASDETYLWRYLSGDGPWFHPFWRQVIGWSAGER